MNTVNAPFAIAIPVANTFYPMAGGLSDGGGNGITFQNASELRIDTPGTYLVAWALALDSKNGQFVEVTILKNGVSQSSVIGAIETAVANNTYCTSGNGVLKLVVGDVVKIGVMNYSGPNPLNIWSVSLTLRKIAP
jgi:hypothetical protein